MPEQDESGTDRNEADYYEKGNDIARRGRTEKPRLKVLRDELPEFTNDELHRLYDSIEKAIRDEVVEALREKNEPEPVTDGGEPEMKSIECPNCGMPYTVPEEADHWSCDCGASWELDPRADGGHDLGAECDVDDCDSRVVGLGDGWEVSRGTVCQDCLDYRDRHGHWPDEDPEICVECRLDEGAIRHECDEAAVDAVILNPESTCDYCGFEPKVMTDGGRTKDDHWQVVEITGVGLGEMWFDEVADELTQREAERRASNRERYVAVPMPYDPDHEVPIGHEVDSYERSVIERA